MAYTTLSWLLGAATERAALHFEDMPAALVIASIGAVGWALFRHRTLTEAVGEYATPVRRIYDHMIAALGLTALAGSVLHDIQHRAGHLRRSPQRLHHRQRSMATPGRGHTRHAHHRRSYMGVLLATSAPGLHRRPRIRGDRPLAQVLHIRGARRGSARLPGRGGGTLFVILRDLLDAALSVETLRDLYPAIGFTLTAALFLPYHWAIYRADQAHQPTETSLDDMSPTRDNVSMEVVYTEVFEIWVRRLRDQRARASIISRIERIEDGNLGDRRSVGGGVSELRVNVGAGYRVYYTIRQSAVVILLCGGDKSSQQQDIRRAQRMAREVQGAT